MVEAVIITLINNNVINQFFERPKLISKKHITHKYSMVCINGGTGETAGPYLMQRSLNSPDVDHRFAMRRICSVNGKALEDEGF